MEKIVGLVIDQNIINLQVYLLFLAAGVLADKAREKELANVYIF